MSPRPNDDLAADPLSDTELADLEARLRQDNVGKDAARGWFLGLLARLHAAETSLARVRAQPKRDELAHELKAIQERVAAAENAHTERALAVQHLDAIQGELDRVVLELHDARAGQRTALEESRRDEQAAVSKARASAQQDAQRAEDAAQAREKDLTTRLGTAERLSGEQRVFAERLQLLEAQSVTTKKYLERRRAVARDVRVTVNEALARLEMDT